jgi:hypothetical protein
LKKQLNLSKDEFSKYSKLKKDGNYSDIDEYLEKKNFNQANYYKEVINITDLEIDSKKELQDLVNSNQFEDMKSKLEKLLIQQFGKQV